MLSFAIYLNAFTTLLSSNLQFRYISYGPDYDISSSTTTASKYLSVVGSSTANNFDRNNNDFYLYFNNNNDNSRIQSLTLSRDDLESDYLHFSFDFERLYDSELLFQGIVLYTEFDISTFYSYISNSHLTDYNCVIYSSIQYRFNYSNSDNYFYRSYNDIFPLSNVNDISIDSMRNINQYSSVSSKSHNINVDHIDYNSITINRFAFNITFYDKNINLNDLVSFNNDKYIDYFQSTIDNLTTQVNNLTTANNLLLSQLENLDNVNINLNNLVWSIFDSPLRVISQMLNFDVFGVNIASMLFGVLTLLIVIWVIKKVI